MTPSPASASNIPATRPSRLRRFGPVGLIALGVAMLLGLSVWLVTPPASGRTVEWGLYGRTNVLPDDVVTAQGTTTIFVKFNLWPACHPWSLGDRSWLTPVITYTPKAVIITLHESALYLQTPCMGMYDDWGSPVPIHLSEPLGGRTLYDGSVSPPAAQSVPQR